MGKFTCDYPLNFDLLLLIETNSTVELNLSVVKLVQTAFLDPVEKGVSLPPTWCFIYRMSYISVFRCFITGHNGERTPT